MSLEVLTSDLSALNPFLEIKWINNSAQEILFGEQFTIYRQVGDAWEDCRGDQPISWAYTTYSVSKNETGTQRYSLNDLVMTKAGKYRFETPFRIKGWANPENTAWIEFELTQGVVGTATLAFDPIELVYDHESDSSVPSAEAAPTYRITNGMKLYEIDHNGMAYPRGTLESITLDKNSFDSRFSTSDDSWLTRESLKTLKKNNYRAWQVSVSNEERFAPLYLLLQQQDGTFYLGVGYHNGQSEAPRNPDNSHIRWLYKLKEVAVSATASERIVQSGTIFFYSKPTLENETPTHAAFYQTSYQELTEILSVLEDKQWYSDALMDRMLYHFDGQLYYEGKWLYFSYESGVFYYDGYLCEGATDAITLIKAAEANADPYDPYRELLSSGAIDTPTYATDEEIARLAKTYPQFFDLPADNGLTVLIWQMAPNKYTCYLKTTDADDDGIPPSNGTTIRDMHAILSTYDVDKAAVTIRPITQPLSSYSYTIDDTYRETVKHLFWSHTAADPMA